MADPKIAGTDLSMCQVVTVTKELYRGWAEPPDNIRRWESTKREKPRAGWVVGKRWLLNGRRVPGSGSGWEYEPPEFRETEPRTPCLLVVYWPTMSAVRVPLDGYELSELEPECPSYQWSDFDRREMSKIMEDMPRDAKTGRWKRILPPGEARHG